MKEKLKNCIITFIIIYCTVFVIFNTDVSKTCIILAVDRCISIIIPSLFAMMVFSGLLIKSGIVGIISDFLKLKGNIFIIFILSMIAGYPVGAKMISEEFERGNISKRQAELYMPVCFGAGPAFIFGCISDLLFGIKSVGIIILICTFTVNFTVAVIIYLKTKNRVNRCRTEFLFNSDIFVESVVSGGKNILSICLMIIFFSVLNGILEYSGVISALSGALSEFTNIESNNCKKMIESILEVTNLSTLEKDNYLLLPFICFASSFGGICVILQIRAVINKSLSLSYFMAIRLICSVLSGILCYFISPLILKNQVISVSDIEYSVYSSPSPVPSYMLVIMIIMLLISFRKENKDG